MKIFLDAVNQLDDTHIATLRWLPRPLPANVHIVLSCITPSQSHVTLSGQGVMEMGVGELSEDDRRDIVTTTLAEYR